jgi:hypothetical protein
MPRGVAGELGRQEFGRELSSPREQSFRPLKLFSVSSGEALCAPLYGQNPRGDGVPLLTCEVGAHERQRFGMPPLLDEHFSAQRTEPSYPVRIAT